MIGDGEVESIDVKQIILLAILVGVFSSVLYMIGGFSRNPALLFGSLAACFIPPAGKESIIPIMIAGGLEPVIIFVGIFLLDLTACFIILTCFEVIDYLIYRTGFLKRKVQKIENKVNRFEKYDLVSLGLIGFMFLPFQGTGAITTSILAQFLRLPDWKTLVVVIIGSVTSSLFYLGLTLGVIQLF